MVKKIFTISRSKIILTYPCAILNSEHTLLYYQLPSTGTLLVVTTVCDRSDSNRRLMLSVTFSVEMQSVYHVSENNNNNNNNNERFVVCNKGLAKIISNHVG